MYLKKHLRLIENFISLSLFKFVDAIIPLIIIPYLMYTVGAEKYGIYAFAYALIFYFRNIVQYGFSLSGVRLVALNKDDKPTLNKIYNNVFTTQLYLSVFCLVILAFLVLFVDLFKTHYIIYLFFSFVIVGELLFPGWFFMGVEKMRFSTIVNAVSKVTFAVLVFLFIKEESDFIYIALYQSIGFLVSGAIAQYIIIKQFKIKIKIAPFKAVKLILKQGLSAFLTLMSPTLYNNTSIFLVGVFGAPQYVGFMEIATKVSGAFSVLNSILAMVFYPFINRNKAAIKKVKYIFISVGLTLSVAMFLLSEFLIQLWLHKPASQIVSIVKILSIIPFSASIISAFGVNGLMIYNKDKLYLKIVIFSSVCGLLTALLLIPAYFYIGGAIAIVTGSCITALLVYISNKHIMKTLKTEANEV
ncbi:oligosaccharide flippase family protein [Lacinutrix undariae]